MRQSLAWSAGSDRGRIPCGLRREEAARGRHHVEQCLRELVSMDKLPVLDGRAITMYSSFDRSGGNNDFNNFPARGTEPGWVTLVDLKGPGCIRRIWMTGMDPGHPIRVFIDGEKKPRVDTTLDDLFGKVAPWNRPVAQFINMCYYSYVPAHLSAVDPDRDAGAEYAPVLGAPPHLLSDFR
jgi:hypothetical protein